MKISKLSAVLALAVSTAAISSFSAQAADGTITFNGKVTDQTCTISTPGGKDFTVTLPTVSASTLATQSATAGRTPFAINLTKCSKGQVATYFEPGATVDFNTGRLNNQAQTDAATNVQIPGGNKIYAIFIERSIKKKFNSPHDDLNHGRNGSEICPLR